MGTPDFRGGESVFSGYQLEADTTVLATNTEGPIFNLSISGEIVFAQLLMVEAGAGALDLSDYLWITIDGLALKNTSLNELEAYPLIHGFNLYHKFQNNGNDVFGVNIARGLKCNSQFRMDYHHQNTTRDISLIYYILYGLI